MKPMGPIPPSFEGEEGMLLIGGCGAASLIDEAGDTPLFVYDLNIVKAQVARFRAVMPKAVSLHYAMKANSYGPLLERMARLTDGFDIASGGELDFALQAGVSRSEEHTSELQSLMRISYAVFCLQTNITSMKTYNSQLNI